MAIYRVKETGQLKNRMELKRNASMSLPKFWDESVLDALGVDPVNQLESPAHDAVNNVALNTEAFLIEGVWTQGWVVTPKSAEEVVWYKDSLAANAREKRDGLLAATDWVVTRARELGQPVPSDVYTYRGDLRQIPEQVGFPETITWPELETQV